MKNSIGFAEITILILIIIIILKSDYGELNIENKHFEKNLLWSRAAFVPNTGTEVENE